MDKKRDAECSYWIYTASTMSNNGKHLIYFYRKTRQSLNLVFYRHRDVLQDFFLTFRKLLTLEDY